MIASRFNMIALLLAFWMNCPAQNLLITSKYYVKEKEVLLRWIPPTKDAFDLAVKNGYRITRYTKENNNLLAPWVVAEGIKPYPYNDTIRWIKLLRKNENAQFALKALYENNISGKIAKTEKKEQAMMLYNMLLLSCDFDADIAKACGLFMKDSTIADTTLYAYKIEIINAPASSKVIPAIFDVNTTMLSTNPVISDLQARFKNKTAELKWKAIDLRGSYGGYNVERSSDGVEFKKINTAPVILLSSQFEKKKEFISYSDTLPKTKVKFYYRIKGINHFGEQSYPSNVVSGIGYEELKSSPIVDSIKVIENKKIFIHWKMSDSTENSLPKEYVLLRSDKDNGKYTTMFKSSTEFNFTDQAPQQSNYYKIGAITHGDDTLFSFSRLALIIDTIPPVTPTGVKAKVDTKGNVEIIWDKNTEADFQGYKIYKANDPKEEFVQINNEFARTPAYKDKLNLKTLSRKIYYCVAATDNNYNTSELSKPIEVKRPDTIPPVSAVIKDLKITQEGIKVIWIPSSSEDVKQYVLYRKNEKSNSVDQIKVWNPADSGTTFMDTLLEFGIGYRYKIIVMDEDDNISVSNNPYMLFETGFRKKMRDIKFEADRARKVTTLLWSYPENEIEKYIVYRAKSQEHLTIIKTLSHSASSFTDNTLSMGNTYEYRIKAVFKNGAESIISDPITVEF